ncbi:MAG: histidinol-phosphate transaminase, partial [Acidobacteriota bacterium]
KPSLDAVRPEIRELGIYSLEQAPYRFKLDQNESPWEPPRRVKERVVRALLAERWAEYPSFHGDELRADLAERFGWPVEGVLAGNGSNELLSAALGTLLGPGRELLGAVPSFSVYGLLVVRAGGTARFLGPRDDLRLPVDELLAEIRRDPGRPLLLCTPNNPTGEALDPDRVAELARALDAPLLLDAAYGEFTRHDYRPLLDAHPNLVLFRTFSKAWALGGLRVGFLLGHPDLVREICKVKAPYNLGRASLAAAREILAAEPATRRRVRALESLRDEWRAMLEAVGGGRPGWSLHVYPSQANFLLVRFAERPEAARVHRGLAERGILVRDFDRAPGCAGCLRFTVGGRPALRATRAALQEMAEETS